MRTAASTQACTLLIGAASASGQSMSLEVRVQHPIVSPGQVQTIELWAEYGPVGTVPCPGCPKPCPILGFAFSHCDLLNARHGETGVFEDIWQSPFLPLSQPGLPTPDGDVVGIVGGQWHQDNNPFYQGQNPILIWAATWRPETYTFRHVEFTVQPTLTSSIWASCPPQSGYFLVFCERAGSSASFTVIPAPGSAAALSVLVPMLALRSRRR